MRVFCKAFVCTVMTYSSLCSAQSVITGTVLSGDDNKPLPGANVFFVNSTLGTTTLPDGTFTLKGVPKGKFAMAVSFIGYETLTLQVPVEGVTSYKVILKPDVKQLAGVTVKGKREKKSEWQHNLNLFTMYFVGQGQNAAQCKILNPEVLRFEVTNKELKAFASSPIIIENRALGYKIQYQLSYFSLNLVNGRMNYDGYPQFSEMNPESEPELEKWERARIDAHKGSMMHFMRAFYQKRLLEEGFVLRDVEEEINFNGKSRLVAAVGDTTVTFLSSFNKKHASYYTQHYKSIMDTINSTDDYPLLSFKNRLEVTYLGEKETYEYQKARLHSSEIGYVRPQVSLLTLLSPSVGVQADGQFFESKDIFCEGYWTWELMADALPIDYVPTVPFENFIK